ncbi:hypothetical protein NGM37_43545, partial [Streptomyces sp. TRM76130]|nr:hypothetical protein [Streptomyces sp. TRM76130]
VTPAPRRGAGTPGRGHAGARARRGAGTPGRGHASGSAAGPPERAGAVRRGRFAPVLLDAGRATPAAGFSSRRRTTSV